MSYIRYFLRCLGLGGLASLLPSVVYEFFKARNGNVDSEK